MTLSACAKGIGKMGSHSSQNNLIIGISLITKGFISTKGNLQCCENGDAITNRANMEYNGTYE